MNERFVAVSTNVNAGV